MVCSVEWYLEGRKEVLKGLGIDKVEREWKEYGVFEVDLKGKEFREGGELENRVIDLVEWEEGM